MSSRASRSAAFLVLLATCSACAQQCYRFKAFTQGTADPDLPPLIFTIQIGLLPTPVAQNNDMVLFDMLGSGSSATVTIGGMGTTLIKNASQFQIMLAKAAGIYNMVFYVIGQPYSFQVWLSGVPVPFTAAPLFALPSITTYGNASWVVSNAIGIKKPQSIYAGSRVQLDSADNSCSQELPPTPPACKITSLIASSPTAGNSPQTFLANTSVPFNPSVSNPPGPGQHLVVFYKDVIDATSATKPFTIKDVEVTLHVEWTCSQYPGGSWAVKTAPIEPILAPTSTGDEQLRGLMQGGLYKLSYSENEQSPSNEVNIVLPLAGAEVTQIMTEDIAFADAFAKAFQKLNRLQQVSELFAMGRPDGPAGNYLGRPDNTMSHTVWMYNGVSNTGSMFRIAGEGAVATWYGVPVRIAKLSNFIVGYAVQRLNVPAWLQKLAQFPGTPNDRAATDSWKAGVALAAGKTSIKDLPQAVRTVFMETMDNGKTQRLWPNPRPADNFVPPSKLTDVDRQFTHPRFLDDMKQ